MWSRLRHLDWVLNLAALTLLGVGLFFIYSAAYDQTLDAAKPFYQRQMAWAACGLVLFFLLMRWDYRKLVSLAPVWYVFGILFLTLVLFVGKTRMGAQRWLPLGAFAFQPSEFSKLTLILVLASYLSRFYGQRHQLRYLMGALLLVVGPMLLILKQPDLGTALIYVPIFFGMLYLAEVPLKYLVGVAAMGVLSSPFLWFFLKEYQKNRLLIFLDPDQDPLGAGYHLIQSKIAVGSGGLFGKGWLHGTQNQLNFLPERHTDFIFSVLGEEWGYVRVCLILLGYFLLIFRVLHVAQKAQDLAGRLVAIGIALFLTTHVFINMGMTIGIMPITGVPLPLLSYGGTSLLTLFCSIALLQNIYTRRFYF